MVSTVQAPAEPALSVYPPHVHHWINNALVSSQAGDWLPKMNPATGTALSQIARGQHEDAECAIAGALEAQKAWAETPIIQRADLLRNVAMAMMAQKEDLARIVSLETGKSHKDALGEVGAAIEMGFFVAGEGRRFYGKTTTSGVPNRSAMTVRQPVGLCALISAANTPIANVAWKAFPALLCGNAAVMKASEDTPYTPIAFAQLLQAAGLPSGVFQVLQGLGEEAGAPLVEDPRVRLVSFTGSVPVGRWIQKTAGERLAKVCLELGGKNPLIVCDDADLDSAVEAAVLSAFSNAGQRCASGSRILVFDAVYDEFKARFLQKTAALKVGPTDTDDLGPVINEESLNQMLSAIEHAVTRDGATCLAGGRRLSGGAYQNGYYLAPTALENVPLDAPLSQAELFGPITALYRISSLQEALDLTNNHPFGLTAAIHTQNLHRAQWFMARARVGVVSINGPTYGSEPHMPFGGLRDSGNGFREAGAEALDVYSEWQTVYVRHLPEQI